MWPCWAPLITSGLIVPIVATELITVLSADDTSRVERASSEGPVLVTALLALAMLTAECGASVGLVEA